MKLRCVIKLRDTEGNRTRQEGLRTDGHTAQCKGNTVLAAIRREFLRASGELVATEPMRLHVVKRAF